MDICKLVENYIDLSGKCGLAITKKDWEAKRTYAKQLDRLELIMAEHCVSIDERENPVLAVYNAIGDPNILYFFHVRIQGQPWKKVDMRDNTWSEWKL